MKWVEMLRRQLDNTAGPSCAVSIEAAAYDKFHSTNSGIGEFFIFSFSVRI
jgi:hypothetical protein